MYYVQVGEADSACLAVMGEIQVVGDCDDHDVDCLGNCGQGVGDDGDFLDHGGIGGGDGDDGPCDFHFQGRFGSLVGEGQQQGEEACRLVWNSDDQNLIF